MTSEIKITLASLASEIKAAANEWRDSAARSWSTSSPSDREMRRVARADAKTMTSIATLVKSGQVNTAYNKASELDTVVREAIPEKFWKFAESIARLRLS